MDTRQIKFGYGWAAYKAIEEDMLRIAEYIPLETQQNDGYSFKLTDIIMRSCSHIDSLFKDVIRNQDLTNHSDQKEIAKCKTIAQNTERGMLTIKNYIKIFADYLSLASVEVTVQRNGEQIKPFKEFGNSNLDDKIPTWWKAYNDLKHDFYNEDNIKQGNLKNALLSLSALFVLNCKIPLHFKLEENIDYLVRNKVITSPNFIHTGHLLNYIKKHSTSGEYNLLAQTSLFQYWLSYNQKTIGEIVAERLHATDRMRIPVL